MATGNQKDELLDIVDDKGVVVGQELRSIVYAKKMKNYRVVDVFLQNLEGETFILKRSQSKKVFPGALECCGEHVNPGESDVRAARRGVLEELQLDIPESKFIFLGYSSHTLDNAVGHVAVFKVVCEQTPTLGREHQSGMWMTTSDIMKLLKKDPKLFRNNVLVHIAKYARELFEVPLHAGLDE